MNSSIQCVCGRRLKVAADLAGKRVKCPACGASQIVPPQRQEISDEGPEEAQKSDERATRLRPDTSSSPMVRMYTERGHKEIDRDEGRVQTRQTFGRDESGGWSGFGFYLSPGVVTGAGLLLAGILVAGFTVLFRPGESAPRSIIFCIGAIVVGGGILVRSLLFHNES